MLDLDYFVPVWITSILQAGGKPTWKNDERVGSNSWDTSDYSILEPSSTYPAKGSISYNKTSLKKGLKLGYLLCVWAGAESFSTLTLHETGRPLCD